MCDDLFRSSRTNKQGRRGNTTQAYELRHMTGIFDAWYAVEYAGVTKMKRAPLLAKKNSLLLFYVVLHVTRHHNIHHS